jgi:hypothetical protein
LLDLTIITCFAAVGSLAFWGALLAGTKKPAGVSELAFFTASAY